PIVLVGFAAGVAEPMARPKAGATAQIRLTPDATGAQPALKPGVTDDVTVSAQAATTSPQGSVPVQDDEIVGPFASWTNLKTTYKAAGDGMADDTAPIQKAFDELGKPGRSPVLFVPRGTYRITRTLTLVSNINISIVGEDPAATLLNWDGAAGGTMLSM